MEFGRSGQIRTGDQLRADRIRRGFCDTCRVDPVRCFNIRRRFAGLVHERIPLTVEHRVYNGICLICRPDQDPNQRRAQSSQRRHHRSSTHPTRHTPPREPDLSETHPVQPRTNGGVWDGNQWARTNSIPSIEGAHQRRSLLFRQGATRELSGGSRELGQSAPPGLGNAGGAHAAAMELQDEEFDFEYDNNGAENERDSRRFNILGERLPADRLTRRNNSHRRIRNNRAGDQPGGAYNNHDEHNGEGERRRHRHREHHRHHSGSHLTNVIGRDQTDSPPRTRSEGVTEKGNFNDLSAQFANIPPLQNDQGVHPYAQGNQNYATIEDNNDDDDNEVGGDDAVPALSPGQPMDELARIIAQHVAKTPDQVRTFVLPSSGVNLLPNSVLSVPVMDSDEISVVTMETALQGDDCTVISTSVRRLKPDALSVISEESKDVTTSTDQRTVASHQLREPSPPQQNVSDYESDATDIATLREIVSDFTQVEYDAGAIEVVSEALIQDNASNRSVDLALFCLTTLWVLARKSDANKHKIIFEGRTFDAIIEVMHLYDEISPEIQTRACGVLWSLAMDSNDRKHVAQLGGCDGILNAMLVHMEVESLQVMALGALKVLSNDTIGKSTLRLKEAASIVADSMSRHPNNPTVQSEGCAILCNLAREANQFVRPVSEKEISAVINAILTNPLSLDVHDGACFALLSFASSAANVEAIRRNHRIRAALEVAYQNHPDAVGGDVQTLIERLQLFKAV